MKTLAKIFSGLALLLFIASCEAAILQSAHVTLAGALAVNGCIAFVLAIIAWAIWDTQ